MECNKFFHFSTGGIIDVNAKIVLINTMPFRTTKFVRNVNLNYYCHLVIINSNSQPMQYSRSFHFNLYIIFETKKEKEREKTIKLPSTWMRKSDVIYLEIGISSEGGGGGGILAALPRNNYDRVARRLIAFNVQPSKLPRNR